MPEAPKLPLAAVNTLDHVRPLPPERSQFLDSEPPAPAEEGGSKALLGKVLNLRTRQRPRPAPERAPEEMPEVEQPDTDDLEENDEERAYVRPVPETPRSRITRLATFVAIVVVPTLIAAVYLLAIAAPQYTTEIKLGVRFADPTKLEKGGGGAGFAATQLGLDSYIVVQYISSREMVEALQKQIDIRKIYSTPLADFLTRFSDDSPIEGLVSYWQGVVDPYFDLTTGLVSIKVRAFTPEDTHKVADAVLAQSERLVNEISSRARRDAVKFSEEEVRTAEIKLSMIRQRLRQLREKQKVLDPKGAVEASDALLSKQREELVRLNTELATLQAYMAPTAPPIQVLKNRIKATEGEIRKLENNTTTQPSATTKGLSGIITDFEELETERQFAEKYYTSALESLGEARVAADRQLVYLSTIVRPTTPESSTFPNVPKSIFLVMLACLGAWLIGTLGYYSIRDHMV